MRFLSLLFLVAMVFFIVPVMAADDEAEANLSAAYHELKPSLVVNLQGVGKYMRCDVQLMTRDDANLEDIQTHSPALRHELLMLLGDQQGDTLKKPKGKEKLRLTALKAIQNVMQEQTGEAKVDDLFFTAFYVQ